MKKFICACVIVLAFANGTPLSAKAKKGDAKKGGARKELRTAMKQLAPMKKKILAEDEELKKLAAAAKDAAKAFEDALNAKLMEDPEAKPILEKIEELKAKAKPEPKEKKKKDKGKKKKKKKKNEDNEGPVVEEVE